MVVSRAMAWGKGELLWMIFIFHPFARVLASLDGDALYSFKVNLDDPNSMLQSWNPQLVSPCTWAYIACNSELKVTRVDLGNAALSGSLVPQLGNLKNLQYLELYNNNITGKIPDEFGNLSSLVVMDLYSNHLSGPIPETLGKLSKLRFLRLNNNSLTGSIPKSLTNIDGLQVLDLSSNHLSGEVPSTGSFSLFTPISFDNNPLLCGVVILKHCPWSPPFSPPPPFVPPLSESSQGINHSKLALIASGVAVGALLLFALPIIAYAWLRQCRQRDDYSDLPAEEPPGLFVGKLKRFSLRELRIASDDFSSANILGRGAFGKVYKGRLADGSLVAIKRLKEERTSCGEAQFAREVEIFSLAAHQNLLRLHGFCMTPTERLLVYPFMVNGSVENCLRDRHPSTPPLDWRTRKNIALGSARGISYLHDHCDPKIIHRDIKAANILLNENFEPLVGDFGLARLMDYRDTHATTAAYGTIGHIAPEYLSTGRASEKADVFGFGITLLEIITGQRTFDLARLASDEDIILLDWVKKILREGALRRLVDPALQDYDATDVEHLLQIALLCTQVSATVRPEMSEVVSMLEGNKVVERWEEVQDIEAAWLETSTLPDSQYTSEGIIDSICSLPADELSGPR